MLLETLLLGASGILPPAPTVTDVFASTLHTGNAASRTITTGINLTGAATGSLLQGGMVWIKGRSGATGSRIFDTLRGATIALESSAQTANTTLATSLTAFGSSGFNLGADSTVNASAATYVNWSFRRATRFFDVVTYTGDGSGARTLTHNLGVAPGLVFVKVTSTTSDWIGFHTSLGTSVSSRLNQALAAGASTFYPSTPTTTSFQVSSAINTAAVTYVVLLFANDTGSDGIIQCGSYTGNGSASGPTVALGWEPQFLIVKRNGADGWVMMDTTRGIASASGADALLLANTTSAETSADRLTVTATGFTVTSTSTEVNNSGDTYLYVAIRKP